LRKRNASHIVFKIGLTICEELVGMESEEKTKCLGCGCLTECSLKCPTCVKLGLTTSYFCSQNCFKENWSTHQKLHRAVSKFKKQANQGRTFGYDSLVCGYKEHDKTTWREDIDLWYVLIYQRLICLHDQQSS
jgi:hypothetical protein